MNLLTWLPRDIRQPLAALNPAPTEDPIMVPPVEDLMQHMNAGNPVTGPVVEVAPTATGSPPGRRLLWPILAAAAVVVVLIAGLTIAGAFVGSKRSAAPVAGPPSGAVAAGAVSSGLPEPTRPVSIEAIAAAWASFPLDAHPRPVVLLAPAIDAPASGFKNGDDKAAFIDGQIESSLPLPAAPSTQDGYPLMQAADAIGELQVKENGPPTPTTLHVVGIELTEHTFLTDRGQQSLPSWQVSLGGVTDNTYVLAIAPASRYAATIADAPSTSGNATISADGTELTFPFTAHHASTGLCDLSTTSTLQLDQTATAVVIDITTTVDPVASPAAATTSTGSSGPAVGCDLIVIPDAGTRTIKLDQPLGTRVVIGDGGAPYEVTVR